MMDDNPKDDANSPKQDPEPPQQPPIAPADEPQIQEEPEQNPTEETPETSQISIKPKFQRNKILLIAIGTIICIFSLTAGGIFAFNKVKSLTKNHSLSKSLSLTPSSPNVAGTKDQTSTSEAQLETSTPEAQPQTQPDKNCETPFVKNGFTICSPASWTRDESGSAGTTVVFRNPKLDTEGALSYTANLNVLVKPTNSDLATFIKETKEQMQKNREGYTILKDEKVDIGNKTGHLLEATYVSKGVKVRFSQTVLVENSNIYLITSASLDSTWTNYTSLFESSIKTFEIS